MWVLRLGRVRFLGGFYFFFFYDGFLSYSMAVLVVGAFFSWREMGNGVFHWLFLLLSFRCGFFYLLIYFYLLLSSLNHWYGPSPVVVGCSSQTLTREAKKVIFLPSFPLYFSSYKKKALRIRVRDKK